MIVACWNIRGFARPLKHNGVKHLIKQQSIDVLGLLETKLSQEKLSWILSRKFQGWACINNFDVHAAGRILVIWNPGKVSIEPLEINPQVIHCKATCKVSRQAVRLSFIYGFHSIVARRPLWSNIKEVGLACQQPWLVLGDFNSVLQDGERCNGADVSPYETRDLFECCLEAGLSDIQSMGCYFTWSNNTVWSKLDRVMVNNAWLLADLQAHGNFLVPGCLSDHSASIVRLFSEAQPRRSPFRFMNMWVVHDSFQGIISSYWSTSIQGSKQFSLAKKLHGLKGQLKMLNNRHFSHISERSKLAGQALESAHMDLHDQPSNVDLQRKVASLRKDAQKLAEAERHFFFQKAKSTYLLNSDKNTKFFHSLMKRNAKRNFIHAVMKADGSPTSSSLQVEEEFIKFYKGLLGVEAPCEQIDEEVFNVGPKVSTAQGLNLVNPVSRQEIKDALFDIGEDKSPGPDGFTSCFFKKSWHIVGDQFCDAIEEFFRSSSLLKQVNHTTIVLIPKSAHSSTVHDFRPISCCNVTYKVISKILASRLAPILSSLVDQAQSAFIQGRSMVDNIHLVQELLRKYNRKRVSPRWLAKVDIRKAYDTVCWKFIRDILAGLGFPTTFINWIMECISSTSFSLLINGNLCGFFKGKRGLRQGDPLSPFLFVLCLEYFSRSLRLVTDNSDFNFHPRCGHLRITHLAFADDLLLLARGDIPSVKTIVDCLSDFGAVSGLKVNEIKSHMYCAGIVDQDVEAIRRLSMFSGGCMPFRYLGVPIAAAKLKVNHYSPLLHKIAGYIKAWKSVALSYAGRAELIKSILQGVECFWLTILPIPVAVIDRIIRLCRLFLWNSSHSLVAWREVCLPRIEGGLGLKDLKCWNLALLAKVLWDFHCKKDTLWVRWVSHVYLGASSIWDRASKKDDSPLLKKIFFIRDQLCQKEGAVSAAINLLESWREGDSIRVTNAYNYFRPRGIRKLWARDVWSMAVPPKHAFTLWLSIKNTLLTKDKLLFMDIDRSCSLCGDNVESHQHLFFQCTVSARIWRHIKLWMGMRRSMSTLASAIKWLRKEARGSSWQCKAKRVALACTVYYIWTARNRQIFEGQRPLVDSIISRVKAQVYRIIFSMYPYVVTHFESLARGN